MEKSNQQIINETDAEIDQRRIQKLITHILKSEELALETIINIVLTDNATIHELNKKFLGRDRPTDVISFNVHTEYLPSELQILGDVYISVEKANEQAENFHVPLQDELQRLVTHGILHLIGHEHDNPEQQEKMEALTEKYLAFAEVEK
ncbi:MAG: rRNA maturation RNase YbeY [Candidatus Celaenobacter antarcticus]|nr:rRNA maturation RNase YbeY [Candidatus Celaenobacter antarcticus]MDP8314154.1 rRNA maturation RNase YbeY [Candidatus Celaenobacter antarcticus]